MTLKVCIHGHFYQPPREDPWTGMLPNQPSAAPFHDWNQRIQDECYRPNCRAMILDEGGDVASRCNTYRHISFNFGPTLLRWMREHDTRSYDDILRADREAVEATGHGNAIAQAYHHAILPLASARDKQTEVAWGVADFKHRFGREPVGMWLPECAIDIASLEVLADHGIQFTIIAPDQVEAIRPIEGGEWQTVDAGSVPTHQPYAVELPSGRRMAVFVYHGGVSQGIAFGGLLHSGPEMAKALVKAGTHGGLVSIATDGESYGHHHRHGEMALAWVIDEFSRLPDVEMVSYERYLALHPPTRELRIKNPSAWSCAHGVGRWNRNCGCAIDPAWSGKQGWRGPLRRALEDLRNQLDEDYVLTMHSRGLDPWTERNHYIHSLSLIHI